MSNLNPPELRRMFSSNPLAVPYDGATSIPHVYIPFGTIIVHNGRVLGETEVDTSSGTVLDFASGGLYLRTTDSLRAINIAALSALMTQDSAPIGSIMAYPGNSSPPAGYAWLRKSKWDKTVYSALYAVVGDTFNDGTQTASQFMLPDAEGRFIRPFDTTGLVDAGRVFGSKQTDALQNIVGALTFRGFTAPTAGAPYVGTGPFDVTPANGANSPYKENLTAAATPTDTVTFDVSRVARTSTETRPSNISLNYIIKVVDGYRNPQLFDMADYALKSPSFARVNVSNVWAVPQSTANAVLADSTVINWDMATIQYAKITLVANRSLTVTGIVPNTMYVLALTQDGAGNRSLAFSTAFKWPGGSLPTLPTAAGAVSYLTFMSSADGTALHCTGFSLDVR